VFNNLALFFGDVHSSAVNEYSQPVPLGLSKLQHSVLASLEWVAEQIKKHKPLFVVCMGDVFHIPGIMDVTTLYVVIKGFQSIQEACKKNGSTFICLVGNHDTYLESDDFATHQIHSLHYFKGMNIKLVDTPTIIEAKHNGKNHRCLCIPYTDKFSEFEEFVNETKSEFVLDFIACHIDAKGMHWNSGKAATVGVDASYLAQRSTPVFNGHHHQPEQLGSWTNVGGLIYRSFQDSIGKLPRGVVVYGFDNQLTRYENPNTPVFHTLKSPIDFKWIASLPRSFKQRINLRLFPNAQEYADLLDIQAQERDDHGLQELANLKLVRPIAHSRNLRQVNGKTAITCMDPVDLFKNYAASQGLPDTFVSKVVELLELRKGSSSIRTPVTFVSAQATNFFSFENIFLNLAKPGLQRIAGRNGAGKSATGEILAFALYGKTIRGAKFEQILRKGATSLSAQVVFVRGEHTYQVTRTWSKKAHTLEFLIDGSGEDNDSPRLKKDIQARIEEALGFNELAFVQTCYFDMERHFGGLSDSAKKEVLEGLLDSPVFQGLHEELKTKERKSRIKIEAGEALLKARDLEVKLNYQTQELAKRRQQREFEIQQTLKTSEKQLAELEIEDQEITDQLTELEDIGSPPEDLTSFFENMEAVLADGRDREKLLHDKITKSKIKHHNLCVATEGQCPFCKRDMELDETQQQDLVDLNALLPRLEKKLQDVVAQNEETRRIISNKRREFQAEQAEFLAKKQHLTSLVDRQHAVLRQIATVRKHIATYKQDMEKAVLEHSEIVSKLAAEFKDAQQFSSEKQEQVQFYELADKHLGPQGVRSFAVDRALEMLNSALQQIAGDFSDDIRVQIYPERSSASDKTIQKINIETKPHDYASLSRSQRLIVSLIIQFGLCAVLDETQGSSSLLVVDECDHGLDDVGIETFINYLNRLDKSILFMSHHPVAQNLCNEVIRVVIENGVSRILAETM
jgi:DNA repair exonuclease SbcCD ATPase subunit